MAVFVMLNLLSFWKFAWTLRHLVEVSATMLLGVMTFACAYYLAARLVFPSNPERFCDLDTHYFRVARVILGILIALVLAQWAFLWTLQPLRDVLTNPLALGLTALLVALMAVGMVFRRRAVQIGVLVALIIRYLAIYLLM